MILRARLARVLRDAGYSPELAESAAHAQRTGHKGIVLAIVVPDGLGHEGETLIDDLRRAVGTVLLLTTTPAVHADDADMLDAADEAGLLTRVQEALRPVPYNEAAEAVLHFAQYRLDVAGRCLLDAAGKEVVLTRGEFSLLQMFARHPGRVLSRDYLLQTLAGREAETFDRSIDNLIVRLRRKIEADPRHPSLIVTVPGSGYKFAADVRVAGPAARIEPGAAATPPEGGTVTINRPRRRMSGLALLLGIATSGVIVAVGVLTESHRVVPVKPPVGPARVANLPLPEQPSIAVLQFVVIGGHASQQRLADGITEDVITDLSRYRELFVIAGNSVFAYKGKDVSVQRIGRELGVRYVLDGSIQTDGDRVRVTAQLIDAATNVHVWSERYDRALGAIFDVQGDVTQKIAAALAGNQGAVTIADTAASGRKPPANLQAYDFELLGTELMLRRTEADSDKAEKLFNKAIELDPQFACAYGHLAVLYDMHLNQGWGRETPAALLEKAKSFILKAIALDPTDGIHYARLGELDFEGSDFDRGLAAFERAVALNPNDPSILMYFGEQLAFVGRAAEGVEMIDRAFRLNPRPPDWYNYQVDPFYATGRYDVAEARLLRAQRDRPIWASVVLALSYAQLEERAETAASVAALLRRYPDFSMERALSDFGGIRDPATLARYLDGARKAGLHECAGEEELRAHPQMRPLPVCAARRAGIW